MERRSNRHLDKTLDNSITRSCGSTRFSQAIGRHVRQRLNVVALLLHHDRITDADAGHEGAVHCADVQLARDLDARSRQSR